jgi:hypothetical protein
MTALPNTEHPLVLRTDFGDAASWAKVRAAIVAPSPGDGFEACVQFVDDKRYDRFSKADVLRFDRKAHPHSILFIADRETLQRSDHPVLVVELQTGQEFRAIAAQMWNVENNLSLANMDWDDFATAVDGTNTFRGFPSDG